jgi:hypothetical protein
LPIVATYDAVRAGVPLFRTLLADDDLGVQFLAAYALAWFVEDAAESLPALTAAAERATPAGSEILVATIWVTVGLLGGRPPAAGLHDPRPLVRWAVAVAMAKNGEADQVAIDELFVWARGAARSSLAVPFLDYDVAGYAALALVQALGEDSERIFAVLLTRLPLVSGLKALPVLGLAVKLAFPAGPMTPGTPYAALSERQQQLLLALADSPQIWRTDDAVFADASRTVREYGLPDSAERLRAYLHPAPNTP